MSDITAVFTSCGRFDLLKKTYTSFIKHIDLPIDQIIIIDNSTLKNAKQQIESIVGHNSLILVNEENIGQVSSIDKAYSYVKTEYIFHCEDDWEFFDTGFLALSKQLLLDRYDIINVNLRVRFDGEKGSMHPIEPQQITETGIIYHPYTLNYLNTWHGFSWNPGLRRKVDYDLIKPYKQYGEESGVGKIYKELNYIAACLEKSYCRHIGTNSYTPKSNQ